MTNPSTELKALAERIDFKRIAALARRVDLAKLIAVFAELEPEDLAHLAAQARAKHGKAPLPPSRTQLRIVGRAVTGFSAFV